MARLTNQDNYIKTALRLPRDTHARIQEAAILSGRSMNSEIVALLDDAIDRMNKDEVDNAPANFLPFDESKVAFMPGNEEKMMGIVENLRALLKELDKTK